MDENETQNIETPQTEEESPIKKHFFTVTPLSKILAMILFVALPFLGFWAGLSMGTSSTATSEVKVTNTEIPQKQDLTEVLESDSVTTSDAKESICTPSDCVLDISTQFGDQVIGYGSLRGYYTQYENFAWGASTTCDAFVVLSGNEKLLEDTRLFLRDRNESKSLVGGYKDDDETVVNLSLNKFSDKFIESIKSSSIEKNINLFVYDKVIAPRGAGACESFIDIYDAFPVQ